MATHEQKIELMRKYASNIATVSGFFVKGSIPIKRMDNALKTFAIGMDRTTVIGFYDTSLTGNGKSGIIFTDDKIYYKLTLEKPGKIWYDDIESIGIYYSDKPKDCDKGIRFHMKDGPNVEWYCTLLNKTPLKEFLEELLKLEREPQSFAATQIYNKDNRHFGAESAGISAATYHEVNKIYDEERFHSRQGHGFAAERANDHFDNITMHDAKIVGDNNAKSGPDRLVDGVFIQTKYCQTGKKCIDECFNDGSGNFKYMLDGKPMQIEVPADEGIYNDAIDAMKKKISEGKVPGVSDPNEAENIIRKGHFTYLQAKNIAKAGTIESITYDTVTGAINCFSAFGITAAISFSVSVWNGDDLDKSLKIAATEGLKIYGTQVVTSILASQLSKAGLNSALVGSSEAIVQLMGPKAAAVLVNAFRSGGSNIYGAAAMKSAAKLLRGNVITSGVTVVVLSTIDVVDIFRGRISGGQLFKNITTTGATVAGGTFGWTAGAALGSAILPGVGTVVGGLAGSLLAGGASGKVTNGVVGAFIEDDAELMVSIIESEFKTLASDYLLTRKEAEKSVDKLRDRLDGKKLKEMYASSDRHSFAHDLMVPIIERETSNRKKIGMLTNEQMITGIRLVLEDVADESETNKPTP